MQNRKKTLLLTLSTILLGACASTDDHLQEYASLSCMQLAEEIGRNKAIEEDSTYDGVGASIDAIVSENDWEVATAGIEGAIALAENSDSKSRLEILDVMLANKGC